MALTIREANAVQRVIRHLTGQSSTGGAPVSRAAVIDDLVHLADHARKPLHLSGQPAYSADEARTALEENWPVPTEGRAASPAPRPKQHKAAMVLCARCHVIRAEVGDLCVYCAENEA
jgi:hypothetical protein